MEVNLGEWKGLMMEEIEKEREEIMEERESEKWKFVKKGEEDERYMKIQRSIGRWVEEVEWKKVCVKNGGCMRKMLYIYGNMEGKEEENI